MSLAQEHTFATNRERVDIELTNVEMHFLTVMAQIPKFTPRLKAVAREEMSQLNMQRYAEEAAEIFMGDKRETKSPEGQTAYDYLHDWAVSRKKRPRFPSAA